MKRATLLREISNDCLRQRFPRQRRALYLRGAFFFLFPRRQELYRLRRPTQKRLRHFPFSTSFRGVVFLDSVTIRRVRRRSTCRYRANGRRSCRCVDHSFRGYLLLFLFLSGLLVRPKRLLNESTRHRGLLRRVVRFLLRGVLFPRQRGRLTYACQRGVTSAPLIVGRSLHLRMIMQARRHVNISLCRDHVFPCQEGAFFLLVLPRGCLITGTIYCLRMSNFTFLGIRDCRQLVVSSSLGQG